MGLDFQKELNKEQYEIVKKGDGPVLVLAGAGSGKTRTLTYRVAYLINKGVNPENILLVTFTNKASKEMLSRIEDLLGYYPKGVWGGTFHHIGNRFLRRYAEIVGYEKNFSILDREDSLVLFKEVYEEFIGKESQNRYFPKSKILYNLISYARNRQENIFDLMKRKFDYLSDRDFETAQKIADRYKEKKIMANAMDFDDLLINWLNLLKKSEIVKNKLREKFQYILVDEYQDTNKIQNEIINLLAKKHKNILAVGDDSQSIYSFRAARIANILDFPKNFFNAKVYKLETNYRSTPEILDLANESIKNNQNKFPKKLKSVKESLKKPLLVITKNNKEQAFEVVRKIKELKGSGFDFQDIAVLVRSVFQGLELELALNRENIPYTMRGGIRFFEQKHIKDILAYLKILANFKDELAWLRVLNIYEGIGPKTAQKIFQEIKKFQNLETAIKEFEIFGNEKIKKSLNIVLKILKEMLLVKKKKEVVKKSIEIILKNGYREYLMSGFDNYKDRIDDLNEMSAFAYDYDNLDDFLSEIILSDTFKNKNDNSVILEKKDNDKVVISTIHQAKGLEWSQVFLLGLVDGQFPHRKVWENPQEIEEERRLFYVAVTRAKDSLYLFYPMINNQNESINELSSFIKELDESLFDKQDKVYLGSDDLPIIEYE